MPIRVLHLVRHGAVDASGGDDPGLDDRGRRQADFLAERLAAMVTPAKPTLLVSSTLRRAVETADLLARALPGARRETASSLCEGFPTPSTVAAEREELGEAFWRAEAERFDACWEQFFRRSEAPTVEVLVSHGNWIRGLAIRALGVDPSAWGRLGLHNCSLTTVLITPDGPFLGRVNDVGHLPPSLVTTR